MGDASRLVLFSDYAFIHTIHFSATRELPDNEVVTPRKSCSFSIARIKVNYDIPFRLRYSATSLKNTSPLLRISSASASDIANVCP